MYLCNTQIHNSYINHMCIRIPHAVKEYQAYMFESDETSAKSGVVHVCVCHISGHEQDLVTSI